MAVLICPADNAALCRHCDVVVHSANPVVARHSRWPLCAHCCVAPAVLFCRNDQAALCQQCDHTVHSANVFMSRHTRLPIDPITGGAEAYAAAATVVASPQSSLHGPPEVPDSELGSSWGVAVGGVGAVDKRLSPLEPLALSGELDQGGSESLLLEDDDEDDEDGAFSSWLGALIEQSQVAGARGLAAGQASGNFDYAAARRSGPAGSTDAPSQAPPALVGASQNPLVSSPSGSEKRQRSAYAMTLSYASRKAAQGLR
jgi:hypothetical protein